MPFQPSDDTKFALDSLARDAEFQGLAPKDQLQSYQRVLGNLEPDFAQLHPTQQGAEAARMYQGSQPGMAESAASFVPGAAGAIEGYYGHGSPVANMLGGGEEKTQGLRGAVAGGAWDLLEGAALMAVATPIGRMAAKPLEMAASGAIKAALSAGSSQALEGMAAAAGAKALQSGWAERIVTDATFGELFTVARAAESGHLPSMEDAVASPLFMVGLGAGMMGVGRAVERFGPQRIQAALQNIGQFDERLQGNIREAQSMATAFAKENKMSAPDAGEFMYRAMTQPLSGDEGGMIRRFLERNPQFASTEAGVHTLRMQRDSLQPSYVIEDGRGRTQVAYETLKPIRDADGKVLERARETTTADVTGEQLNVLADRWQRGQIHIGEVRGPEKDVNLFRQRRLEAGPLPKVADPILIAPEKLLQITGPVQDNTIYSPDATSGQTIYQGIDPNTVYAGQGAQPRELPAPPFQAPISALGRQADTYMDYLATVKPESVFDATDLGPVGGGIGQPPGPDVAASPFKLQVQEAPTQRAINASGEPGGGGLEAQGRVKAMQQKGEKFVRISRDGSKVEPLIGVDAADAKATRGTFTAVVREDGSYELKDLGPGVGREAADRAAAKAAAAGKAAPGGGAGALSAQSSAPPVPDFLAPPESFVPDPAQPALPTTVRMRQGAGGAIETVFGGRGRAESNIPNARRLDAAGAADAIDAGRVVYLENRGTLYRVQTSGEEGLYIARPLTTEGGFSPLKPDDLTKLGTFFDPRIDEMSPVDLGSYYNALNKKRTTVINGERVPVPHANAMMDEVLNEMKERFGLEPIGEKARNRIAMDAVEREEVVRESNVRRRKCP